MHDGMKIYRGAAAAARHYVEADRSRADDLLPHRGSGVAMRIVACPESVEHRADMDGATYERWVAGYDVGSDKLNQRMPPKGRLRKDDKGVRFVRVTVNGPKTWSLAAALDPKTAAAYDAAQMAAAEEIIGVARHPRDDTRRASGPAGAGAGRGGRRTPFHLPGRRTSSTPAPPSQLPSFRETYKNRNVVERSFNLFKQWRGLATRYDKLALTYHGGVVLCAITIWLRQ